MDQVIDWLTGIPAWEYLYYFSEWAIRLVMLVVITRKERGGAMAWLLVIFFAPWTGLVLYLLLANDRLPARRIEKHAGLMDELASLAERFEGHPSLEHPDLGPGDEAKVQLAEHLGQFPILGGNEVELFTDSGETIDRLVADIDAAQTNVHLLFYIWGVDATAEKVNQALERAAQRGVCCRVLVDAVGGSKMLKRRAPKLRAAGVHVYPALAVSFFRRKAARFDLRNHRKIAVIDGHVAYTGSQNIVEPGYGHKDITWHDLMIRLTGPVVLELQSIFLTDWYFETMELQSGADVFPDPIRAGEIPAQVLPSGPSYSTENFQRLVVADIYAAHEQLTFTTPYFVPDEPFMQALEVAVMRGVDVRLIVPGRFDQRLVAAASKSYYARLLRAGVKIFIYGEGLIHSKTMRVDDDVALIGTSNFDIRSFALNYEVSVLFYGTTVNERLGKAQEAYLAKCTQLTAEEWEKRGFWCRVGQNLAKLFSPLL